MHDGSHRAAHDQTSHLQAISVSIQSIQPLGAAYLAPLMCSLYPIVCVHLAGPIAQDRGGSKLAREVFHCNF